MWAEVGRGGRKIGFNKNHYMRSHIHSRRDGAGAKSSPQGIGPTPNFLHPLQNCVHKSTFSITGIADLPASLLRMCEHTHGNGEGMSNSACLHSATTPRIRERNYRLFKEGQTLATSILLESGVICLCQAARTFFPRNGVLYWRCQMTHDLGEIRYQLVPHFRPQIFAWWCWSHGREGTLSLLRDRCF